MTATITKPGVYELPEAEILLPGGHTVLLDAADVDLVAQLPWRPFFGHKGKVYAQTRWRSGGTTVYMHRLIMATPDGYETDHRNGNGLDNRRANLRIATPSQNRANTAPMRGSSQYKGVSWSKHRQKWVAYIQVDSRTRNLGGYATEVEAAAAYDVAALEAWGEFAVLNLGPS